MAHTGAKVMVLMVLAGQARHRLEVMHVLITGPAYENLIRLAQSS